MASRPMRVSLEWVVCVDTLSNSTWRTEALTEVRHTIGGSLSCANSVLPGGLACCMFFAVNIVIHMVTGVQRREVGRTIAWRMLE